MGSADGGPARDGACSGCTAGNWVSWLFWELACGRWFSLMGGSIGWRREPVFLTGAVDRGNLLCTGNTRSVEVDSEEIAGKVVRLILGAAIAAVALQIVCGLLRHLS